MLLELTIYSTRCVIVVQKVLGKFNSPYSNAFRATAPPVWLEFIQIHALTAQAGSRPAGKIANERCGTNEHAHTPVVQPIPTGTRPYALTRIVASDQF